MDKKSIITPPPSSTMTDKDVPDYFCGRLIYRDDTDAMRYVVYDGSEKHRFASRAAAEVWCIENSYRLSDDAVYALIRAYEHTVIAANVLRRFVEQYGSSDKTELEAISVALRRVADRIDTITSQYIH